MELPKFLVADNSDYPEVTFVVHTEKPRFILDVDTQEYALLDKSYPTEDVMAALLDEAQAFFESELDKYEEDEEEGYYD